MSTICRLSAFLALITLIAPAMGQESRINVRTPTGAVIPKERREDALAIGVQLLSPTSSGIEDRLTGLQNPFVFQREPAPGRDAPAADRGAAQWLADLTDQQILGLVATNFQRQITGTMIMGDRRILLRGRGRPIEVGFEFQARVSPEDPRTFTIRVAAIEPRSFTIALNESQIAVPIGEPGSSGVTPGN